MPLMGFSFHMRADDVQLGEEPNNANDMGGTG